MMPKMVQINHTLNVLQGQTVPVLHCFSRASDPWTLCVAMAAVSWQSASSRNRSCTHRRGEWPHSAPLLEAW